MLTASKYCEEKMLPAVPVPVPAPVPAVPANFRSYRCDNNELALSVIPPLVSTYNDRIQPFLDVVDQLRHLEIMKEGIQLPTIVVVGDQSSGKSSVLESLAGISLPRGHGICTRVPLVMRLQHHIIPEPELYLEYHGKRVYTDDDHISEDISIATDEIAGTGKGISNTPLTLVVRKDGVPDITMVDLPGITRVPVHGQPKDIYEQISGIIMEYISPKESIILNVLSATVDFPTCESIRMSQRVDKTGERTLAVVTKADKAPEGLLEKVAADDVNIGLGFVCVRNRIGDESYEVARVEEARLFGSHPLLSKIDKSIVGIPVLAQKLVDIQAKSIGRSLPGIIGDINEKLNQNVAHLSKLPKHLSSIAEAMTAFMQILGSTKESLRKILVRREFDEYLDDAEMHCTVRMAEMLEKYTKQLQLNSDESTKDNFLMEEIAVLEETKLIGLPNFISRTAFLTILQRKLKKISGIPIELVEEVWNYIENVVVRVVTFHSEGYPQLQNSFRRASHNLILKMRDRSVARVKEMVEMEKLADYTCDPEYMSSWNSLMAEQDRFMNAIARLSGGRNEVCAAAPTAPEPVACAVACDEVFWRPSGGRNDVCMAPTAVGDGEFNINGYGEVEIGHLKGYPLIVEQAFDMRMRITAYWKIVLKRMLDNLALHLLFNVQNLVNKELETEIINEMMGSNHSGSIERLLEESPSLASRREKLNKSIRVLKQSKDIVSKIMDRIVVHGDNVDY